MQVPFIDTASTAQEVTLRKAWEACRLTRKLRESTLRNYQARLRNQLGDWLDVPIIHITEDAIQSRHEYVTNNNGPAIANSAMRTLRAIIRFAQFKYRRPDRTLLIQVNPVQQMNELRAWNKDKRRTRIIAPGQMKAWYGGVMQLHNHVSRDLLLFLIFTGTRWEEASALEWHEIDLQQGLITLRDERCKNGRQHVIPLSDYVWRLLHTRRQSAICPYVFPNIQYKAPITSVNKACSYVTARSGVPFSAHDCRRSFLTLADDLEIPKDVRRRLVNHVSDTHDDYVIASPERLRRVTQRITDTMLTYMQAYKG